jgi:hypothetical protein
MITAETLRTAIDQLDKWSPEIATSLSWVNWRKGFQIKMTWFGGAAFACYLDFGKNAAARDAVLKRVFSGVAPGEEPKVIDGHGWSCLDYSVGSKSFISVNEVAAVASSMGFEFKVLYVQESISARPVFHTMGIPLIPGETGKEWVNGEFISYSCPPDQCL